ncbi:hypothetical protein [Shewanella algae]|uniref:hypothetical protein n=1 Tax=Shewanella algae TaxID=38313 RepID=UPI0005CCF81C|nr:hypothetical protein [Shewanella algae]
MATILIEPVDITTSSGSNGQITGIDVTDGDCLVGTINGHKVRWDRNGTCRNQTSGENIDPKDPDVADVLSTVDAIK